MYNYDPNLFLRIFSVFIFLSCILIVLALLAFTMWMLVDCINREEKDFKDRTLWIVLLLLGIFSGWGLIFSTAYYFAVKRKLDK